MSGNLLDVDTRESVYIMAEEKAFKKLFLQRSVLDTLRVYIDPSQDFLDEMEQNELLTEDELIVVKVGQL